MNQRRWPSTGNQRGFALLAVLWLTAMLAGIAAAGLAVAREGQAATRNRLLLVRAQWAREGCLALFEGRYARDSSLTELPRTDLGRNTWCTVLVSDPTARINVNLADSLTLRALMGRDDLTEALLDWRDADDLPRPHGAEAEWYRANHRLEPRNGPLSDVQELERIRGFDSTTVVRLERLATTRGTGTINLNDAPPEVLAALDGFPTEAGRVILSRRAAGRSISSLDELLGRLPPPARESLARIYAQWVSRVSFAPQQLLLEVEGGVGTEPPTSRAFVTVVPIGGRLAVIRRESE
jgi:general secretion pathway protein K